MFNFRKRSADLKKRYVENNYINYNKFLGYKKEVKDMSEDEIALVLLENDKLRKNNGSEFRDLNREIRNLKNELQSQESLLNTNYNQLRKAKELEVALNESLNNVILNTGKITELEMKLNRRTSEIERKDNTIQNLKVDKENLQRKINEFYNLSISEDNLKEKEDMLDKKLKLLNDYDLNKQIEELKRIEEAKRKKSKDSFYNTNNVSLTYNTELNDKTLEMENRLKELDANINKLKTGNKKKGWLY